MVQILGIWYLRKAERVFDPLAQRAAQRALETAATTGAGAEGARFSTGSPADIAATTRREKT
jgi:hypothetical protein